MTSERGKQDIGWANSEGKHKLQLSVTCNVYHMVQYVGRCLKQFDDKLSQNVLSKQGGKTVKDSSYHGELLMQPKNAAEFNKVLSQNKSMTSYL